ncbi:MAG: hypothetical protein E6R03_04980 [Hyphomicrobiaceae bacterium]|nr:MAG: hypothetical protein E6R03_04980 [Hyphomicrobiaceae bacterium]
MADTDQIVRRPTPEDVEFIIANIRDEDVAEIAALDGGNVRDALNETPDMDKNAFVWEREGKVHAIFGVNPVPELGKVGVIWLLATKTFDDHFMVFAAACKTVFGVVIKDYEYLFNYVHSENKKSIKWLKWLGFDVEPAEPIGINGAKFHRFEMVNEKCAIQ